jgi:hypothetical protein
VRARGTGRWSAWTRRARAERASRENFMRRILAQPPPSARICRGGRTVFFHKKKTVQANARSAARTSRCFTGAGRFLHVVVHHVRRPAASTSSARSRRPAEVRHPKPLEWRVRRQRAHCRGCIDEIAAAPPPLSQSRSTLVMTTYDNLQISQWFPRDAGFFRIGRRARPACATSQNGQRRVQMSPRIMKVAVPLPKHSRCSGRRLPRTPCAGAARAGSLDLMEARIARGARTRIQSGLASFSLERTSAAPSSARPFP